MHGESFAGVVRAITDGLEPQGVPAQLHKDFYQTLGVEVLHVGIEGSSIAVEIERADRTKPIGGVVIALGHVTVLGRSRRRRRCGHYGGSQWPACPRTESRHRRPKEHSSFHLGKSFFSAGAAIDRPR